MTRKRIILAATMIGLLSATVGLWRLAGTPVFLETAQGRYRVLSSRYIYGTNLTFSADSRVEVVVRRLLERVGIHLKGSRGGSGFRPGVGVHAIALLCRGRVPSENLMQIDAECITESGQTVRLNHRMTLPGSRDRVYFIFHYVDSEIANLHRFGLADSEVTKFCPAELRVLRRSDHQELSRLDLSR